MRYSSTKSGQSNSGTKNWKTERKKRKIAPIKCVCTNCLYYNRKVCKFGKETKDRKKCIKFITVAEYNKK